MKISEIRIDRTKSLGNYENVKLGFTAVVDEDESPIEAIERVKNLLDWEINREDRDRTFKAYTKRLAELEPLTDEQSETERAKITRWIEKYEAAKEAVEALR